MNSLFITLYLDEDVDVLLADLMKAHGFEATTTTGIGARGKSDAEQMAFAVSRDMAILTHNRSDFERLSQEYFSAGQSHAGIIIAVRRPVYDLARRLLVILNFVTADEMQNQIRYI